MHGRLAGRDSHPSPAFVRRAAGATDCPVSPDLDEPRARRLRLEGGRTPNPMDIDEITETFEFFDDWEDRYRYLIELGRDLEGLDDSDKTEENRVQGCVSNVWLVTSEESGDPVRLAFRADSDAHIVRGLVAVLLAAYSGRSPEQILATDIRSLFERLDLASHLSPSRSNGFFAMVERIKGTARGWTQSASAA